MENLQRANDRAHALIENLYIEALEAVLGHRVDRARDAFARFEAALNAHLQEEQEHLVPRLVARGVPGRTALGASGDGTPQALRRRVERTREVLARLDGDSPTLADEVIDALEMLWLLRCALDRHGARERRVLYARLDEVLPPAERSAAVHRLAEAQQQHPAGADATA